MKKSFLLLFLLFVLIPCRDVNAKDYTLKYGKEKKAGYAGADEAAYNYFKFTPTKSGFAEIKVKTSNKGKLQFDICDSNRKIVAENIEVSDKKTVLHRVKKGNVYYIRTKGTEDATHTLSYKIKNIDKLTYAQNYSYTFTNASFYNEKNAILFQIKAKDDGNLSLMCNASDNVVVKYLNSKKKKISNVSLIKGKSLTGIGALKNKVYYIKLWKQEKSTTGTTNISDLKYQIKKVSVKNNTNRKNAITLSRGKRAELLVPAGKKTSAWYRFTLNEKQTVYLTLESGLYCNDGDFIQFDLCNEKGKKLNTSDMINSEEVKASYSKKKLKFVYKGIEYQAKKLPKGTYYIRVKSNSKTTSGSCRVKWNTVSSGK